MQENSNISFRSLATIASPETGVFPDKFHGSELAFPFHEMRRKMLRPRMAPNGQIAGRIKTVHTSREINLTHANVMSVVAVWTIECQC
jgi:hypothetical protein